MCEMIQVTKWLPRSDVQWCKDEVKRITNRTGDKCQVVNGDGKREGKVAVVRWMKD